MDTTHVFRTVGNTERVYKNSKAEIVRDIEEKDPGNFEALRPHVSRELYRQSFQETGDVDSSVWSCGQSIGLIEDIPTCDALLKEIVAEAEEVLDRLAGLRMKSKL
jgi:NAD(P)H-dependent flavin oxidoreductase YrpB (nitropropane dioxygenase family)